MRIVIGLPSLDDPRGYPQAGQNRQFQYFSRPTYIYPIIPASAATMLQQAGHDVQFWDGPARGWTEARYLRELCIFNPALIAWEVKTPTVQRVWALCRRLRQWLPMTTLVLMGDHITALPDETQSQLQDIGVVSLTGGDYDYTLQEIVSEKWPRTPLRGIRAGHTNHDLATLPLLNRGLTRWQDYAYENGNYHYYPATYTMWGRDCWWRHQGGCTFCSWTTTFKNFRVVSVDQAMAEVEHCASLGIREVFDDTGTFPMGNWLHTLCDRLRQFNHGHRHGHARLTMGCNLRPGALTPEEYQLLGAAGFRFVLFGLESANQATLDRVNKGQSPGDLERSVRWATAAGLDPHVTCMVGYPWETQQHAERTVAFTRRLFDRGWIKTLQATIIIPYPGTELFRQAEANNWLKYGSDWSQYDMRKPVLTCPMSDAEVLALTRAVYRSVCTPRSLARQLWHHRHPRSWPAVWRGVRLFSGHLHDFAGRVH